MQFSPANSDLILYNHEYIMFNCGIRRMNLFDGKRHYALRQADDVCNTEDWTCHEMWSRDGKEIYYHGGYVHGGFYVGRVDPQSVPDGKKPVYTEIRLPDGYRKYGHFTEGSNGMLVTDGYYQEDEQRKQAVFISVLKPQWEKKEILWTPLCRHDSSWSGQDAHPHSIFNHKSDRVYFTSDFEGSLKTYWAEVGE